MGMHHPPMHSYSGYPANYTGRYPPAYPYPPRPMTQFDKIIGYIIVGVILLIVLIVVLKSAFTPSSGPTKSAARFIGRGFGLLGSESVGDE